MEELIVLEDFSVSDSTQKKSLKQCASQGKKKLRDITGFTGEMSFLMPTIVINILMGAVPLAILFF